MQEISDKDIKLKISEFCTTSPQTRVSGSAKLRTRIREDNPGWQISERRFRRLRNEVQKEDIAMNPQLVMSNDSDGQWHETWPHTIPGEPTQHIVEKDGVERTHLPRLGVMFGQDIQER